MKKKEPNPAGHVTTTPGSQYIHEVLADFAKVRLGHPNAQVRSVTAGTHVIRIAIWKWIDNKIHTRTLSVLHPKDEKADCRFKDTLGSRKLETLFKEGIVRRDGVRSLECPNCGIPNPIGLVVRIRCKGCGIPLVAVRVRR